MKSPWKSFENLDPDRDYLVLASSIPAKKMSSMWKMFRGSTAVRRQLAGTDGVIGFSLLAQPFTRTTRRCRCGQVRMHSTDSRPGALTARSWPTSLRRWVQPSS